MTVTTGFLCRQPSWIPERTSRYLVRITVVVILMTFILFTIQPSQLANRYRNYGMNRFLWQTSISRLLRRQKNQWRYPLCVEYLTNGNHCAHCSFEHLSRNLQSTIKTALKNVTIALIGDSRIRHIFAYLRSLLDGREIVLKETFNDTVYVDPEINVQLAFYARWYPDETMRAIALNWSRETDDSKIPHYVLMETGAWTVFRYGECALDRFRDNLQLLAEDFAVLRTRTTVIWIRTLPIDRTRLTGNRQWSHRPNADTLADEFGEAMAGVAQKNGIVLWNSIYHDSKRDIRLYKDVVHPGLILLREVTRKDVFPAVCQLIFALDTRDCQCRTS